MGKGEPEQGQVYASAALGYRVLTCWKDGTLASTGVGSTRWRPGANLAYCRLSLQHDAPARECRCGFYAYHQMETALHHAKKLREKGHPVVVVSLAARGQVMAHQDGFRAEEVALLGILPEGVEGAQEAARRYELPLAASGEELKARGEVHAQPVPEEVRLPHKLPGGIVQADAHVRLKQAMLATSLGALLLSLLLGNILGLWMSGEQWVQTVGWLAGLLLAVRLLMGEAWSPFQKGVHPGVRVMNTVFLSLFSLLTVWIIAGSGWPRLIQPPSLRGPAVPGEVLRGSVGEWREGAQQDRFPDQKLQVSWLRCNSRGERCRVVSQWSCDEARCRAPEYVPAREEVGGTVRLRVQPRPKLSRTSPPLPVRAPSE